MFASALDEGKVYAMRGDYDHAIKKLGDHLNGDFFDEEALYLLGNCFMQVGGNGIAATFFNAAIQVAEAKGKKFPSAMINLGGVYKTEHNNEMAEKMWREALKIERVSAERSKIFTNLATLYVHEGSPEQAIHYADLALKEDPDNHKAHANRGMACLELGRWREGWEGWRHTYASGDREMRDCYGGIPEWDGSPGKTVIVWGDQGIGDEIFFASALPDLQRISKKVILDCHPRLPALFQRSFPEAEVYGTRKDLTELPWVKGCGADAHIALADLFSFFRNAADEWVGRAYMNAPPLDLPKRGPRIGISWTGGSKRTRSHLRSISIEMLEPIIMARPDAQWFSLQYTPDAARDVCKLEEKTGIRVAHYPSYVESVEYGGPGYDYDRTASFVSSLDLVITVCTTIHHLGGALGVPTWTLVPKRCSWRYMSGGDTLPWYNSVRLFRQETDGDWSRPITRVAGQLSTAMLC